MTPSHDPSRHDHLAPNLEANGLESMQAPAQVGNRPARIAGDLELVQHALAELSAIQGISNLLDWDQAVYMPPGGWQNREMQGGLVNRLAHITATEPNLARALYRLKRSDRHLTGDEKAIVRSALRDVSRAIALPREFVELQCQTYSRSYQIWEQACVQDDFKLVQPHLERVVELAKREIEYRGFETHPYEALLDGYDPGISFTQVNSLILSLSEKLRVALPEVASNFADVAPIEGDFPLDAQEDLSFAVAEDLGYDFTTGRIDVSTYPFMTTVGFGDKRILTTFATHDYRPGLYSTIHETGHALYEQGFLVRHRGTPLAAPVSHGIHEAQARLWENLIGRGLPFMHYLHERIGDFFPGYSDTRSPEDLWREINAVSPSLIRTEADEFTYTLHIAVRMIIEEELITDKLKVSDLPDRWDELSRHYLGVTPTSFVDGVLQDVHWYIGLIGYFPSYLLGNLYGTQMMEAMRQSETTLDSSVAAGDFTPVLRWLRENVHHHGRRYTADELMRHISGQSLSDSAFLRYLSNKFHVAVE